MIILIKSVFSLLLLLCPIAALLAEKSVPTIGRDDEMVHTVLKDLLQNSYSFVDLGISNRDMAVFDQLTICGGGHLNRYGNLDLLKEEIPKFLLLIGNENEELVKEASQAICKIVSDVTDAFGKETAWICIRASEPESHFDIPRWHMDGPFFSPRYAPQYKFAAALKGNQTLFYPLTSDTRKMFCDRDRVMNSIDKGSFNLQTYLKRVEEERIALSELFDVKNAESAPKGYGAFFIAADQNFSALHSEPKFDSPRLFISILPGHECEIKELEEAQKKFNENQKNSKK